MSTRRQLRAVLVATPGGMLDPAGRPPLPEHLAVFEPAAWIDPDDLPPGIPAADVSAYLSSIPHEEYTERECRAFAARAMARLRWHRARRQWACANGYTMREIADPPPSPPRNRRVRDGGATARESGD